MRSFCASKKALLLLVPCALATSGCRGEAEPSEDGGGLRQGAPDGASADASYEVPTDGGATLDLQRRCGQPGVIVCQGFDDPSAFVPARYPASGAYVGKSPDYIAFDGTVAASGAGSLRFTIPSMGGPGDPGYWRQLLGTNFGAGSTFYVQFRQRFSPAFLTNRWPANGGGTTYWKQEIFSNQSSTCGQIELTTINGYNRGFPQMYSQCGADPFEVPIANSDYLLEQGDSPDSGYNCHYHASANGPDSCFLYPSDTWVTFYYQVQIGTFGQPNSSVLAWTAVGGQPYRQWINITQHVLNEDTPGQDYDMVTLLPYMTQRDAAVDAGPTSYTWYDELIVSTQPIASPDN